MGSSAHIKFLRVQNVMCHWLLVRTIRKKKQNWFISKVLLSML